MAKAAAVIAISSPEPLTSWVLRFLSDLGSNLLSAMYMCFVYRPIMSSKVDSWPRQIQYSALTMTYRTSKDRLWLTYRLREALHLHMSVIHWHFLGSCRSSINLLVACNQTAFRAWLHLLPEPANTPCKPLQYLDTQRGPHCSD